MDRMADKKYYDPEYDRIVTEDTIQDQYNWFSKQEWFTKSYEEFRNDNFIVQEDDNMEQLDCLHDKCIDCPHWTGTECDGDLPVDAE